MARSALAGGEGTAFSLPDALRQKVRTVWAGCPYPTDPSYFADFLRRIELGKLDPDCRAPERSSGERSLVNRGRIFCGNLGSGILSLNVRAIFPGSADPATWGVDIEVCDKCRDVELALIARLARSNVGEGRVNVEKTGVKEKVADLA